MRLHPHPIITATDLANHPTCAHLTTLSVAVASGHLARPHFHDPTTEVLAQRGRDHEARHLAELRKRHRDVVELPPPPGHTPQAYDEATERTRAAMHEGADVIVQPTLFVGPLLGRADFLVKVPQPSALGDYGYEVHDTKLATVTKGSTILQLCVYAELLAELQGVWPERVWVVPGGEHQPLEPYRVAEYVAYYRAVKARLLAHVGLGGDPSAAPSETYPEPCSHCDVCDWFLHCDDRRRRDDHLSLVAGIHRGHRTELVEREVVSVEALARMEIPLSPRPRRGHVDAYTRVREQARVQVEGRTKKAPVYEFLDLLPERGLARLPAPSAADVFFDIEGDRYAPGGGHEYLFGLVQGEGGTPRYEAHWALTRAEERRVFEQRVDDWYARWRAHPDMHIYHYAPYEPTALKRLMGTYGTREAEVDALLRGQVFVDLYTVVRQAIRASVESYSIKKLEPFYGYAREVPLEGIGRLMRQFEVDLEMGRAPARPDDASEGGEPGSVSRETLQKIEGYNRDDCVSTLRLRDWLESLRTDRIAAGLEVLRPVPPEAIPDVDDDSPSQALYEALMARLPEDFAALLTAGEPVDPQDRAIWVLAHLLSWHRRENKVMYWEVFSRAALTDLELLEDRSCLSGLTYVGPRKIKRSVRHVYRYPPQEHDLGRARECVLPLAPLERMKVVEVDDAGGQIVLGAPKSGRPEEVTAIIPFDQIPDKLLREALLRLAASVDEHGLRPDEDGEWQAARRLLLAEPPRVLGHGERSGSGPLLQPGESTLAAAKRLVLGLDHGVLPIQGPPGAGKTFTGAHMIVELVRQGKRVGVTANSHKVIANLLDTVVEEAEKLGIPVRVAQKIGGDDEVDPGRPVREFTDNKHVDRALDQGEIDVLGGTAWLWARECMETAPRHVDVLFIDEAGQMALANALAVAAAADSLVLLGDPQQLDQPLQGSHPEGADVSVLEHMLAGHTTMPPERGLFLDRTWRLHPEICRFTSDLFYEGRLEPIEGKGLDRQRIQGPDSLLRGRVDGSGLRFVPVHHTGNQNHAPEEVDAIADLTARLLSGPCTFTDRDGDSHPLRPNHILVVAPYNTQVHALRERLPQLRVGTVDKFQGQEAPIVIYSMTTSTPEDAPRGLEFLYSPRRFNVATSRAQALCVVVGSPALLEPDCRTPRHMRLANVVCAYVERA